MTVSAAPAPLLAETVGVSQHPVQKDWDFKNYTILISNQNNCTVTEGYNALTLHKGGWGAHALLYQQNISARAIAIKLENQTSWMRIWREQKSNEQYHPNYHLCRCY
jgi:hypothetical protein